jgi:glycolate oxidase
VAGVLAVTSERALPVIPRGAGSNLSAGTIAQRGGIMLALTRMDRLLELDAENLVAVCQPGLPSAQVGAAAAEHGLLYPPDPGSRTTSTTGGNVAENPGGMRGLEYGVTRDYVLGCEAVLATDTVIRAGGKLVKDVAGYDLVRLLCGSEGTLAVLTELTLRLVPAPEPELTTASDPAEAARLMEARRAALPSLSRRAGSRCWRTPPCRARRSPPWSSGSRPRARAIHLAELLADRQPDQGAP